VPSAETPILLFNSSSSDEVILCFTTPALPKSALDEPVASTTCSKDDECGLVSSRKLASAASSVKISVEEISKIAMRHPSFLAFVLDARCLLWVCCLLSISSAYKLFLTI